jgi:hypothetical protein
VAEQQTPAASTTQAGSLLTEQPAAASTSGGSLLTEAPGGTTAPGAPEGKPEESGKKTEIVETQKPPEKYELKLKENSLLNQAHVESLETFAKDRGLTNEQAQKILERDESQVSTLKAFEEEQRRALTTKWVSEVKADQEIGGEKLAQTVELSHRLVNKFGSQALKQALNETGFGNHPELIRFVSRIAKSMSDDQLVLPSTQSVARPVKSPAEVFYGKKE